MVGFPLLLIPIAVYNIVVWLMPGVSLTEPLFRVMLLSRTEWPITLGDMLLALGVLLILLEIIKGARPGSKYLTDHLLSLIVFGGSAAEFLLWPKFGNSTFFLLALLSMVDFFGGIALHTRRRLAPAVAVRRPVQPQPEPEAPAPMRRIEPVPVTPPAPAPSAASVAESVLLDHPKPQPSVTPSEPSPQIPSPELQPNGGSASPDTPQR